MNTWVDRSDGNSIEVPAPPRTRRAPNTFSNPGYAGKIVLAFPRREDLFEFANLIDQTVGFPCWRDHRNPDGIDHR